MDGLPKKLPLNFGLVFFAPISSVAGSATIQITQPLLVANVTFAPLWIVLGELALLIANAIFALDTIPLIAVRDGRLLRIPLGELRRLLSDLEGTVSQGTVPQGTAPGAIGDRGFLTAEEPGAPLIIGLSVFSDYSEDPDSPNTQFIVPLVEVRGLRGALPMLILGLLMTIFVRAAVPPEASGAKPFNPLLTGRRGRTFNLSPEALTHLLERFGKYFSSN